MQDTAELHSHPLSYFLALNFSTKLVLGSTIYNGAIAHRNIA